MSEYFQTFLTTFKLSQYFCPTSLENFSCHALANLFTLPTKTKREACQPWVCIAPADIAVLVRVKIANLNETLK